MPNTLELFLVVIPLAMLAGGVIGFILADTFANKQIQKLLDAMNGRRNG